MSQFVAIPTMVSVTPGAAMYSPAVVGTWTASPPTTTSANYITVDGTKVIIQAECVFNFAGTGPTPPGSPVVGSSTVTLNAGTTILRDSTNSLLVVGDTTSDSYGNTVSIVAGQIKLKTA